MANVKKEHEVIMLHTHKKSKLLLDHTDELFFNSFEPNDYSSYQNLYILSDEEIKEGDWYIRIIPGIPQKADKNYVEYRNDKKIIATTDESLELPKPSFQFVKSFIEQYNIDTPITKVMVEYKKILFTNASESDLSLSINKLNDTVLTKLKVDSNNCITITKIKDSWNRDEVTKLIELAWATASAYGDKTNEADCRDWIKHNLK